MGIRASKKEMDNDQLEAGIVDNQCNGGCLPSIDTQCTELSHPIAIDRVENVPCNGQLPPVSDLIPPNYENECAVPEATRELERCTDSALQPHCSEAASEASQKCQEQCADAAEGFLQSKPTEIDIRAHVCQKAGDKWPAVCTYLGVPLPRVQMARGNNPHQEEDACFEAVMFWRNGNTSVVVSWLSLLEALKRAGLGAVANSIAMQNGVEPVEVDSLESPSYLQHAKEIIHKQYKEFKLTDGGKQMQFVKLAVIENLPKARLKDDRGRVEFLKRYQDYGIRMSDMTDSSVTVNHFLDKGLHRARIIYGQPGTGKTTFLKHLCQKVANGKLSDFSLVLFFPLRDKAVSQALQYQYPTYEVGLQNLLQYYIPGREKCCAAAKELMESEGRNVLMIFDGADEARGLMASSEGSLLIPLLEGRLLPQAHFIVSTRPGGCPLLHEHSNLFYEILGFDEEAVESYVKDYFQNEPDKGEAMLSDLRSRPDLMGGAYIPMNLLIFCSIYEHGVVGKSAFPPTMTDCYKCSIARTVTHVRRSKKRDSRVDPSLTVLPVDIGQLLLNLSELAFNGLSKTPPVYIFEEDEVRHAFHATIRCDETLDDSAFGGLLHLHPSLDGFSCTLNFSHTTKQEFFAAYHLHKLSTSDQAKFWKENHLNPKYAVVLKFFAGLTQFKSADVSHAILPAGGDLPSECDMCDPSLLYVFHTLFESQNEYLTQSIVQHLKHSLSFGMYLGPFDIMAVSYCLTKCSHLRGLELTQGHSQQLTPASFRNVLDIAHSNTNMSSLYLPLDTFTEEDARALCQATTSLKSLALIVNSATTPQALALLLCHKKLEDLFINLSSIKESSCIPMKKGLEKLENTVSRCNLKKLRLDAIDSFLIPILNGLRANTSMTELAVSCFEESAETSQAVARCTQFMPALQKLYIVLTDPLPVLEAMGHRTSPLEEITVLIASWFLRPDEHTKVYWNQLKTAASSTKVKKLDIDVNDEAKKALECGLSKNELKPSSSLLLLPGAEFWHV